ncbi:hypothetical protein D3C80_1577400 [compost metagenome]
MAAGLGADRGKGALGGAVFVHVFATSAAKHAQGHRHALCIGSQLGRDLRTLAHDRRAILPLPLEGTRLHLFKTQRQRTLDRPAFHRLARQVQGAGAGGAVVVDIDHRNTAQADFIQCRLARGGVAVHVTDIGLLH